VLFGIKRTEQEEPDEFSKRWGWYRSTKLVADYENVSVTEAYKLNVFYFLNILAYLKDLNKEQERQYKEQQWRIQHQQSKSQI
jgi:hypothetical protein